MIRYQLECPEGHNFDSWFQNSSAFEKLVAAKQIGCPKCGSTEITKSIMAPNVGVKANKKAVVPVPAQPPSAPVDPKIEAARREALAAMRKLRQVVEENAHYVGPQFAEEARKIHYKEAEEKGIYGEATVAEVKELAEEGIECHPLPILPEDQN
ncbi:MAG: DUF1178 family protein [Hyphomicrobiaceae bacterium]